MNDQITAARIRQLRKERKITQKQLATDTGLPYQSIVNYENGRRTPNAAALATLERFFNVSGEFLCGTSEVRRNEMIYDDPEIMDEVRESFSFLFNNLLAKVNNEDDHNQKMLFDIIIELQSVLDLKDVHNKSMLLEMIADSVHSLNNNVNRYTKAD